MMVLHYLWRVLGFSSSTELEISTTTATRTLQAIRDEDEAGLRKSFWWPLTLLVPAKLLRRAHDSMRASLGPLESFGEPTLHRDGYFRVMKSLVKFQRARFGLTVNLWGDKVIGIMMHPPISIGLAPAWEAPQYVDNTAFSDTEISMRFGPFKSKVGGTLTMPINRFNVPAVLMVPGSGMLDRDASLGSTKTFKDIACGLASAGYAVLRMDKPLAYIALKQFALKSLTLEDEYVTHHIAALKYLAYHPNIASDKIFVLGASLGGRVGPRICASSPIPVAGMISCAGPSKPLIACLISQLHYTQHHFPRPPGEYEKELAKLKAVEDCLMHRSPATKAADPTKDLPIPIPLSYLQDDFEYDPIETVGKLQIPMLFVHGKQDWQVEVDQFDGWKDGLAGLGDSNCFSMRLYDDVGHLLVPFENNERGFLQYDEPGHVKVEIIRDIIQWMDQVVTAA